MILLRLISWPYFRKHVLRTMLTVAGIVLGVAVFVGMHTANQSVLDAFSHTVDRIAGKTDIQVTAGEAGFAEDVLDKVWEDWHECRSERAKCQRIRDTRQEYLRMCDGNTEIAEKFLAKLFSAEEIAKATLTAKNDLDQAISNERVLQENVNEAKSAATALGRKGVDYAVLLREAESKRRSVLDTVKRTLTGEEEQVEEPVEVKK